MKDNKKSFYIFLTAAIVLLIADIYMVSKNRELRKNIDNSRLILQEIITNRDSINTMSEFITSSKRRIESGKNRNINTEIEKVAELISAKKNLKKINFISKKKEGSYNREDYELRLEGIDINSLINFIYRIKNLDFFIKITSFSINSSFENPSLLNATIVISYIS